MQVKVSQRNSEDPKKILEECSIRVMTYIIEIPKQWFYLKTQRPFKILFK